MKIPRILKNSALYSIVTFLQKCVSFLLLPLYTAFLSPDDYGTISVVLSVSSFVAVLIMMSLNGAATRFHYKNRDYDYRKALWGTITTMVILSSLCWGVIAFALHSIIIDPLIGNISFYPFVALGLANTIITPLYLLFQSYLQASQEAGHYSINTFTNFLTHVGLAILFIAVLKLGALGMLLANVVTALIFFIYVFIFFIPKIKIGIDRTIAKESLNYSLPLVPHHISLWSAGSIDRLCLNSINGTSSTGIYSVAQQFGQVIGTIAYSVNQAFVPWFFEQIEKGHEGINKVEKVGNCAVFGYSIIAFIMSLFAPEILTLMVSENFRSCWQIIPYVAFAFVFHGAYFFFINVLFVKDTGHVFIVTTTSMAINVVLNLTLVPIWGIHGCGIACFMTYFFRSIMAMVISIRKNKIIRYKYLNIYILSLSLFVLANINWILPEISIFLSLILKCLLCILLLSFFYVKYKSILNEIIHVSKSN